MGDSTHNLTAQGIENQDTMTATVPADVQREEGIAIDDEVEVAINGVSELIDRASFRRPQIAGDKVTIPADVVRQLGLVAGETYEFEFEKVEASGVSGAIPDEEVSDDEDVAEAIEEAESESNDDSRSLGELFGPDDEEPGELTEEQEEEQEEEGLGELFG